MGLVIRTPLTFATFGTLAILTVWCSTIEARQVLGKQSEEGFRCLIRMAREAQLGRATVDASVGIEDDRARVELLGDRGTKKTLVLAAPHSAPETVGYFEITAGPGADQQDVLAVGRATQICFRADPFESTVDPEPKSEPSDVAPASAHRDPTGAHWSPYDAVASFQYTIAVISLLSVCVLASVSVLWFATPGRSHDGRRGSRR